MISAIEKDIVYLLERGDKKAITLLYENYADSLYGVIQKIISDEDTAQDVLQETFVKIWRYAKKYDSSKAKLFTWLYRIAYNTAIDKVRSLKNKTTKEVQIETSSVYKITTNQLNDDVLDIQKHLSTLEEKYQIVINALFFEGMTQQEASEELDIPLGTIKSRLKIGLRELKKIYNP
ncbi:MULTISPECIES: RNA polymerase sigma factor [Algibacter]|uniref:RNA polymerase sigma factor n=1 Tax=Algibacter lectus TaxID=221126 RepID=A0A090X6K8_9FLAO|nr:MULTISPECIES: sigma-70 family RNA polymerase sigma factor [Algibacter]MDO7138417.1 sigma-70 family RNA polymerase sigma factor [Algibacter lectus]MWW26499.1 sigma-70 family RNA polymerase sigma factor [Algibacter lectus]TDY59807.1 RNA polymerase sigma-70 factor (ECF subfamily) [Algibacter lectus]SFD57059.1 RNA polymerase sigma-70 factor, ECF subfamily [Algibacter lectus]GAL63866.1 RNA polymerase sigma-70 factor [Algibacter lectus]